MRNLTGLTIAVAIALVATTPVDSRQFRAGTALVMVDVVATRADGNLNHDLKRDDFLIFEDGKPQEIRQFQIVDLETVAAEVVDPPGVFSNRAEPGAVFALVLDDMNIDPKHTSLLHKTAQGFIDGQVRSGDYVGVMRTGMNSPLLLTTDRELVRPLIAKTQGLRDANDLSAVTGATGDTLPVLGAGGELQMPDFSALGLFDQSPAARIQAEQSLVMVQRVVEYLCADSGAAQGRAAVQSGRGVRPRDVRGQQHLAQLRHHAPPAGRGARGQRGHLHHRSPRPAGVTGSNHRRDPGADYPRCRTRLAARSRHGDGRPRRGEH